MVGAVLLCFGALAVAAVIINDQEAWADLGVGDCFDFPANDQLFVNVTPRACDEPHDAQVIARFVAARTLDDPWVSQEAGDELLDRCVDLVFGVDLNTNGAPEDILISYISPDSESWRIGERQITCLVESELGLLRDLFRD